jgi:aminoglycoside phosphotransferase (APT) family kinase protein
MTPEPAGTLAAADPLHALLAELVPGADLFDVYRLNPPDGSVYLYVDRATGTRIVGKFYGPKWLRVDTIDADLRSLLVHRELENLQMLRDRGFGEGPHVVPRPLAARDDIDWVLLEEFVDGVNLHDALLQTVRLGGDLLRRSIVMAAELLARLHAFAAPPDLLPPREAARYFEKLLVQLQQSDILSSPATERLRELGRSWEEGRVLADHVPVMIHGDATPEHFLHDEPRARMYTIDVESLRLGDPAEDLGYLAGEIKHLFWAYTRDDEGNAEPFIRELYLAYSRAAALSAEEKGRLTERARFFMACAELRIARNAWLPMDKRKRLASEAEQCLQV